MSDTLVLAVTTVLALGTLGGSVWSIWHIARHTPTRQRALSQVLGSMAGTALLSVVLPAMLKGVLDPFPVCAVYVVLSACAASVLAWRWRALEPGNRGLHRPLITLFLLVLVLAVAGMAVT